MKKILLSLLALLMLSLPVMAQAVQKGYYRVQNFKSKRYIFLVDYKTKGVIVAETSYDVDALRTFGGFSNVVSDPSTVYYIENVGGTDYNLKGQGKDVFDFVGRYLTAKPVRTTDGKLHYMASGIYQGVEVFLYDSEPDPYNPDVAGFLMTGGSYEYKLWDILPVSATDDNNYFGIQPEVTVGGQRYAPFFASFPFTPAASGMKVFTVSKVDGNMAVISEVQGKVAGGTPVIIACPGATPSDNRINIEMQDCTKPANLLSGEYFNSSDFYGPKAYHYNALPWDAATMRILGITKEGKLGFIKSTTLKTIPRNKAFLKVSADAPDEITLMTQTEYEEEKAKDKVTVTARNYSREYGEANPAFEYDVNEGTLKGQPTLTCEATETSPVGTYPIVVSKGTVTNNQFTAVNGTLTVTQAPLTITAKSYTIKQNESLPAFEVTYSGFKNNEDNTVLTHQPVVTCVVPEDTYIPVGEYTINVDGAEAQNYAISYVPNKLTVIPADPVMVKADDATAVYGEQLPTFTYTIDDPTIEGQPVLYADAPVNTPAGTYAIVVEKGTLDYPNLIFQPGMLTIEKAPLTVSVGNYSRTQGEANPVFELIYEGFKYNDDAQSLLVQPTATCEATVDSAPGFYDIIVDGGQSLNYTFNYVNGVLEVIETQGITAVTVRFDKPVDIYTVDGRCVRRAVTTMTGLPRGLYIVEGRKVVVR